MTSLSFLATRFDEAADVTSPIVLPPLAFDRDGDFGSLIRGLESRDLVDTFLGRDNVVFLGGKNDDSALYQFVQENLEFLANTSEEETGIGRQAIEDLLLYRENPQFVEGPQPRTITFAPSQNGQASTEYYLSNDFESGDPPDVTIYIPQELLDGEQAFWLEKGAREAIPVPGYLILMDEMLLSNAVTDGEHRDPLTTEDFKTLERLIKVQDLPESRYWQSVLISALAKYESGEALTGLERGAVWSTLENAEYLDEENAVRESEGLPLRQSQNRGWLYFTRPGE